MRQRYVLDTNILIQAYTQELYTGRVQTLLQGLDKSEPDEINIPEFTLLECANVLWQHVRRHGMPAEIARESVGALLNLPLTIHEAGELLLRAFEITLAHNLALYDSVHIALTEKLNCPLITLDDRQAHAARAIGIWLKPITDFPEFTEPEE